MRLKTIIFVGLITIFTTAKGQSVLVGLELGSNIIPVETTEIGTNFHLGPYAGVKIKYDISDNFSLSSGLFYSQRKKLYFRSDTSSIFLAFDDILGGFGGGSLNLDSLIDIPGADMNVYENTRGIATENYIELPVIVTYNIKNITISAGPYIGFLLNGKKKEEIRTTTPLLQTFDVSTLDSSGALTSFFPPADETVYDDYPSIDELKRFDVGIVFGIGYKMDKVAFNLNYTTGFNDYRLDMGENEKDTHTSVRVSVSYFFNSSNDNAKASL